MILLSFFDGIGSAALCLQRIGVQPVLHVSWETDEDCRKVISHHFPEAHLRHDVCSDNVADIIKLINECDPDQTAEILMASGPPCPDFSIIREKAPGRSGPEGQKFDRYCEYANEIEQQVGSRIVHHLCENVVMANHDEASHFSQRLNSSPVAMDSADFSPVNRPRLFWTRIKWSVPRTNPFSGQPLRWGRLHRFPRLHVDQVTIQPDEVWVPQSHQLHHSVLDGSKKIPCFTTPAPTGDGRPAPKRTRGAFDGEQRQRWLADGRQFAPWQYQDHALLHARDNSVANIPVETKEQLHGFSGSFTRVSGVSERSRHRMMANSWHVHIIHFLLLIMFTPTTGQVVPIGSPVASTALQRALHAARNTEVAMGFDTWQPSTAVMEPASDMWDHWRKSVAAVHPLFAEPLVEPGALGALHRSLQSCGEMPAFRRQVVHDLRQMVDEWTDFTDEWYHELQPHVALVYNSSEAGRVQVPLFLHLLEECKHPGLHHLKEDLTHGFEVVGKLHPGSGWLPRLDDKYSHPISMEQLKKLNFEHVSARLRQARPDEHWAEMLKELLVEKNKGRLSGPFELPDSWPGRAVGIPGHELQQCPDEHPLASMSFSVTQPDKIRRIEDWAASHHNSTIMVHDVPTHHTIGHYVDCLRWLAGRGILGQVWGHDLDAAYRQLPVRFPHQCYVLLNLPDGPTFWRHHALSFGSSASVWSFNRWADAIQLVSRRVLHVPVHHFVDDFAAVEGEALAVSGFEAFSDFFTTLGIHTKAKKAQPPAPSQKMLGVIITTSADGVLLSPCPERTHKVCQWIATALHDDRLSPTTAQTLAGKINFLSSTMFGKYGRAALQPIYARAANLKQDRSHQHGLTDALRAALQCLGIILKDFQPRWIPFKAPDFTPTVYADAFFQLGDERFSPSSTSLPQRWTKNMPAQLVNGWGIVARFHDGTVFASGTVPIDIIKIFCARRAYIYFLEIFAQVLAVIFLRKRLKNTWVAFIDNTAGHSSLMRGYGRDPTINRLLAYSWALFARLRVFPHFEWVASGCNISDGVSRGDLDYAFEAGWTQLRFDLQPLVEVFQRVAVDLNFAIDEAVTLTINLLPCIT